MNHEMKIIENNGWFDVVLEDGYVVATAKTCEAAEAVANDPFQKSLLAQRTSVRTKDEK